MPNPFRLSQPCIDCLYVLDTGCRPDLDNSSAQGDDLIAERFLGVITHLKH